MTIQEPKQATVDKVVAIDEAPRRRVYGNYQTQLEQSIDVNGGHMPEVIFSKLACNLWVINSILGSIYRGFRLLFPVPMYYL
jgi:hypothetical protein